MAKIRNFAEIAPNLPFTEYDFYEEYRGAFEKTELGRMKKILPLHELAKRITWTQILPETKGPEEVLQASGHRAGHWLPEIRPPEDAELPQGHPWGRHQHDDGRRSVQYEASAEKNALSSFVSCLLALVKCLENMLFENENRYASWRSTLAMAAK